MWVVNIMSETKKLIQGFTHSDTWLPQSQGNCFGKLMKWSIIVFPYKDKTGTGQNCTASLLHKWLLLHGFAFALVTLLHES